MSRSGIPIGAYAPRGVAALKGVSVGPDNAWVRDYILTFTHKKSLEKCRFTVTFQGQKTSEEIDDLAVMHARALLAHRDQWPSYGRTQMVRVALARV